MRTERPTEELLALGVFGRESRIGERMAMLLKRRREFSPRMSGRRVAMSGAALLGLTAVVSLTPRVIAFAEARPAFEVASVRPDDGRQGRQNSPRFEAGGINFEGVSLAAVIGEAYNVPYGRIIGPSSRTPEAQWGALATGYGIVAKAPGAVSKDQLRLMLQSLLAERFKLAVHHESVIAPVYALTAGKDGPKLEESAPGGVFSFSISEGSYLFRNTEMMRFVGVLQQHLDRPVVDATGLKGQYNFRLKVPQTLSDAGPVTERPKSETSGDWISSSIFTELQKVGRRLAVDKAPVDYLVVDHVEKPDAN